MCDFMQMMNVTGQNGAITNHLFGSLSPAMCELFRVSAEEKTDSIRSYIEKSGVPLAWQTALLCRPKTGQFYPRLLREGICHGLSIGVRSEHAMSRIDLYGNGRESFPFSAALCADALLIAVHLHEAAELVWLKTASNQLPLLSAREIECLDWSAQGKTSAEIGIILGISQRTVYFHLKNAATKLGVYTTRHAIRQAFMMGILKPSK